MKSVHAHLSGECYPWMDHKSLEFDKIVADKLECVRAHELKQNIIVRDTFEGSDCMGMKYVFTEHGITTNKVSGGCFGM